jgi:hypothetical protein
MDHDEGDFVRLEDQKYEQHLKLFEVAWSRQPQYLPNVRRIDDDKCILHIDNPHEALCS